MNDSFTKDERKLFNKLKYSTQWRGILVTFVFAMSLNKYFLPERTSEWKDTYVTGSQDHANSIIAKCNYPQPYHSVEKVDETQ